MPSLDTMALYVRWMGGDEPTPPAASAANPKPKSVIDLGEALKRAYSKDLRRIA